jgi:choline kinase
MLKQTRYITGTKRAPSNNTFIILSAGTGRRTKNYGNKSLIPYGNKRIIDHQVETIKSTYGAGIDIILVTGYMSDKVVRDVQGLRIVENPFFESANIVESMRIGINSCLESNVFFIHGDLIFSPSFIKPPSEDKICVPVDKNSRLDKTAVGVVTDDRSVKNFSYGLPDKWSQIVFFPQNTFSQIKTKLNNADKNISSFEFMNDLIESKYDISYYESPKGKIKEVHSMKDAV